MEQTDTVTVRELVQNARLKVLQGEDYLERPIVTSDICRPALEFAGDFTHYPAMRIQLLLSLIHISEPTRLRQLSRMPSSA